jgi:hypothetical protein
MTTTAAMARRRAAQLDGRDVDDAELTARGIVNPERFSRIFATWP